MYKLMIVDDEVKVRDSIVDFIDLEEIGFTLVRIAANGMDALEYFEEDNVEVLITDINMPFLDGLGLVSELRKQGNDCRVIFLTGYDEFEYAKEAVALNVDKYILKPITKNELTDVLKDIKKSLDEKYNKTEQIKNLQNEFDKNKKLITRMTLFDILDGKLPSNILNETISKIIDLPSSEKTFNSAVAEIKIDKKVVEEHFESNYLMFFYTISEFCRSELEGKGDFIVLKGNENKLLIICLNANEINNFETVYSQLIRSLNLVFSIDVIIGIGRKYKNIEDLKLSYEEANQSLDYQLLDGSNRVIIYRENSLSHKVDERVIYGNIKKIIDGIAQNDMEKVDKNIDIFFSVLSFYRVEISMCRTYTINLVVKVFEHFNKYFEEEETIIDFSLIESIVTSRSEEEIKESIVNSIKSISSKVEKNKKDERLEIIREASAYLKENYAQAYLDLSRLASQLHVSTSYLSREFKRIKGKTVIEYLTDIRMEKAKDLLKNTNKKVFEISMSVGYEDANYFSYNFRKHIGTSPLKYRKGK